MKILLLVALLTLTSCLDLTKSKISIPELDLKLSEEWIYAEKILKLKYNDVEITRPPGFEQLVMEIVIPQKGGLTRKTHCVYYLVPYKEKISHFRVQELKEIESCPENSDKGVTFISIDGINNLKITFINFKLINNCEES